MTMTKAIRHVALVAILLAATLVCGTAAAQTASDANGMLSAWQMDEAKQVIEDLSDDSPGEPSVMYLKARYSFFQGDYADALQQIDQALSNGGGRPDWEHTREIIKATHEVTKDYKKFTSPKGRFEIFVEPGKDEVLVPFAGEALDDAYDALGEELGYYPPTPIRIEVYPTTSTLAKVSSLTEQEIRTSGTIALCKYNRLMITSPKALLRGYGWVDTLIHEYVHYVVNSKTKNRVPIWMHEGLAKFLERRWRGPDEHRLSPSVEHMLQKRVKANDLITFEEMHPSMAKLPSQEDAGVAFAEVYTVMEYLREKFGPKVFVQILDAINEGLDAQEAVAKVVGKDFAAFEREWRASLKTRPPVDFEESPGYEEKLVFRDEAKSENEISEIEQPEARDHMHLGEMLQARDRYGAALVQYQKARRLLGNKNPILLTRMAQCLRETNEPEEALEVLQEVRHDYPGYVTGWLEMGRSALAAGKWEQARDYLREAARINPFDPEIHEKLAEAYEKLGLTDQAEKYRKYADLVS
ncbi:MAG: peptidase MA family metallohydrolase [Myxococcota bacterium]